MSDYQRMQRAIDFIRQHVLNASGDLTLQEIADHLSMSPWHFQRVFSRWVGLSPKQFQQQLNVQRAKTLLQQPGSLLTISDSLGLSSSSRLYDQFIRVEAMTPGEYRSRGEQLTIRWLNQNTPFGEIFVALTQRGVCRVSFDSSASNLQKLREQWPKAELRAHDPSRDPKVVEIFANSSAQQPIVLHLMASEFQLAVWRALLELPEGALCSYKSVAEALGKPKAARAVGRAVGSNPVAILIPCHRVIRENGGMGGYAWGEERKQQILLREALRHR
ncbi:methylated-DNA--[protein]-cysteine S-methyltransferase [Spongiibacter sp. KMU-166]|uniref:Methylated-DNA--[protein]-cysteine S-methyltransferase n=1 Tax=Spongiibacter thalassae TaxID=2721624 RepID=A0ABX1GFP9_9GAMM|nr:methylated-DNA--[protein]-cysteine S-methyltransferase [Spongiibacter thalassae]NKI17771.1 methylated-DNA--[protein]-cysteine S-methyltransferase [Spongiibacter thalassae]